MGKTRDHIEEIRERQNRPDTAGDAGDIAALLAEVATLREALKPFATAADAFDIWTMITRGDLRRARDVLGVSRLTEEPK